MHFILFQEISPEKEKQSAQFFNKWDFHYFQIVGLRYVQFTKIKTTRDLVFFYYVISFITPSRVFQATAIKEIKPIGGSWKKP